MERVRSLSRSAGLALSAVVIVGGLGCKSAAPLTNAVHSVRRDVLAERPEPASQIGCLWQRSLAQLPDPSRDGMQFPGLPGQIFLLTPSGTAAEVDGDLAVMVYDETPRKLGTQARDPELWHFDKATLAKLVTSDDRFGRCYALFLPWPAHWKDVTQVRILARYESKGLPTLFAREQKISLDLSPAGSTVWTDVGSGRVLSPATLPGFDNRSVPDPQRFLQEAARQQAAQRTSIQQTGGGLFPAGPAAPPVTTGPGVAPAGWPTSMPPGPTMPAGPATPVAAPPENNPGVRGIVLPTRSGL
jgi:hypothetical protein